MVKLVLLYVLSLKAVEPIDGVSEELLYKADVSGEISPVYYSLHLQYPVRAANWFEV